jgi:arginyl-tRNA--protein-N-Asp/Glu arginylyltransferase
MKYLTWKEEKITDLSPENVARMYDRGFVFTRLGKGVMQQTRSVRIDMEKFSMNSENRRILKKVLTPEAIGLFEAFPLPLKDYDWTLGKMAKDFYDKKFGPGIMSVQKIKEILTDQKKSNFNVLARYVGKNKDIGWSICYENNEMFHYSYPFYDIENSPKDMGLGMMTMMISFLKDSSNNKSLKYVYLGSLQRPTDTYKLQFSGIEWFDGEMWQTDLEKVKELLKSDKIVGNE